MSDTPQKHAGGAPSKFTRELGKRICAAVAQGGHLRFAAESQGVHYATVRKWLTSRDPKFREFAEEYTRAQADFVKSCEREWIIAFPKDWRAIAMFLARRFPVEYAKPKDTVTVAAVPLFDPREQALALARGELFDGPKNGQAPHAP